MSHIHNVGSRKTAKGLGLIEVLVAMGLSLLLLIGVITIFTSTRSSFEVNDRTARIQENGRYAMDVVARDIRSVGYPGCKRDFNAGTGTTTVTTLNRPAGLELLADYDDYSFTSFDYLSPGSWTPALDTAWLTSSGVGPADGSDVLLIRRPVPDTTSLKLVADMATPDADILVTPTATANAPFRNRQVLMISNCESRTFFESSNYTAATGVIQHIAEASGSASGKQYLGNLVASLGSTYEGPKAGLASAYKFYNQATVTAMQTVIYFVRLNTAGTATSLWRRIDGNPPEELVEGVDAMQVQLGVDTSGDSIIDAHVTPSAVTDPRSIVSVTVTLLVRSLDEYGTITKDTGTYDLLNDGTAAGSNTDDFAAPADRRLRQVFTVTSSLRNTQ